MPGPGGAGERRQRPGHQRRGAEDRGVAGMNDAKLYSVIRAPRVSEKTARRQAISNPYAFEAVKTATKADTKSADDQIFSVEVQAVSGGHGNIGESGVEGKG